MSLPAVPRPGMCYVDFDTGDVLTVALVVMAHRSRAPLIVYALNGGDGALLCRPASDLDDEARFSPLAMRGRRTDDPLQDGVIEDHG